jgi:hypothetical protein
MSDLMRAWLARDLFDEVPEGLPPLRREEDDEGGPLSGQGRLSFAAAADTGQHWKDELRIPKGNGDASGQWTFTPWKHLDLVLAEVKAVVQGVLTVENVNEYNAKVGSKIAVAGTVISALMVEADGGSPDPRDPVVQTSAEVVGQLFLDAAVAAKGMGLPLPTLEAAAKGSVAFAKYDWSLLDEDSDVGANDPDGLGELLTDEEATEWEKDLLGGDPWGEEYIGEAAEKALAEVQATPVGATVVLDIPSLGPLEYTKVGEGEWQGKAGTASQGHYTDTDLADSWHTKVTAPAAPAVKDAKDLKPGDVIEVVGGVATVSKVVPDTDVWDNEIVKVYDEDGFFLSSYYPGQKVTTLAATPASGGKKKGSDLAPGDVVLFPEGPFEVESVTPEVNSQVGLVIKAVSTEGESKSLDPNYEFDVEVFEDEDAPPTKLAGDLAAGDTIVVDEEAVLVGDVVIDWGTETVTVTDEDGLTAATYKVGDVVEVMPGPAAVEGPPTVLSSPTKKAKDVGPGDTVNLFGHDLVVADVTLAPDPWGGQVQATITTEGGETYAFGPEDDVYVTKAAENAKHPSAKGWTKVGGAKGSNPGGTYAAPDGDYYVKHSKSALHARNEALAARLYALAGVATTDPHLVTYGDSDQHLGTAAKIIEGEQNLGQNLKNPVLLQKVGEGFAADAWLGNWDVVGLGHDNVITTPHGTPVRVDLGGSLLFRAQGTPKGAAFGTSVTEWDSLRDASTNPQSASVFGWLDDKQLKQSASALQGVSDADIDGAVDDVFGEEDKETAALLKATLKARRDDVLERAGLGAVPPEAPPTGPAAVPVGESVLLMPAWTGGASPVEYTKVAHDEWTSTDPKSGGTVTNSDADLAEAWDTLFQQESAPSAPADLVPVTMPVVASALQPGDTVDLTKGAVLKKSGGVLVQSTGADPTVAEVKVGPKWATVTTTTGQKLWIPADEPLSVTRDVQPTTFEVQTHKVQTGDTLLLTGPVLKKSAGKLVPAESGKQGKHDARPVVASIKHGPKWTEVVTTSGQKLWIGSGEKVMVKHTPGLATPGAESPATPGGPWKGKPAPVLPQEPEAPVAGKPPAAAWAGWVEKVKARYDANPNKAKATLEQSNNWSHVQSVTSGDQDLADPALKKLLSSQYLDQALHDEAVAIYQQHAVLPAGAQAKYAKALAAWQALKAQHEADLKAWQAANPSALKGMSGGKVFPSNDAGVAWANKTLPKPESQASIDMVKEMKGSSGYVNGQLWNNGGNVPDSVKTQVAALDAAMAPLPEDIYLFRGTDLNEFKGIGSVEDLKKAVGTTFVQHGFQPTGLGVDTAFSGNSVQIVYRAPAGTMGVWARPIKPPPYADEREFMLARNTRYFIHSVTVKNGKTWVEAEIIPDGASADPTGQPPQPLDHKVGTYFASRA